MKDLLYTVGNIVLELRETKQAQEKAQQERIQQEMGMWLMSQFLQNPDSVEKVVPAMQALADFGKQQQEEPPAPSAPNRSARRRQQKSSKNQ